MRFDEIAARLGTQDHSDKLLVGLRIPSVPPTPKSESTEQPGESSHKKQPPEFAMMTMIARTLLAAILAVVVLLADLPAGTTAQESPRHSVRGAAATNRGLRVDPGLPDGRPEPSHHHHHHTDGQRELGSVLTRLWTDREDGIVVIPYYIRQAKYGQEYGFSEEAYETIVSALTELEARSHTVRFRWWQDTDEDYVLFKRASNGCSSSIGRVGGYQEIWLAGWCETRGSTQHEIYHALGFDHEQNRPDRDDHVTINWNKIDKDWWGQYSINNNINSLGTDYDYYSVMHYSSGGGKIDAGEYTDVIGQRNGASRGDIESLRLMYQCESGPRTISQQRKEPCTEDCRCGIAQTGCSGDKSCQGDLVCREGVCSAAGSYLEVSRNYYSSGENVTVSFRNQAGARAWLGVYPAEADPRNLEASSEDWTWPCGSQDCQEQSLTSGTVDFTAIGNGAWRVYLILDMKWPYQSIAFTETFVVGSLSPDSVSTPKNDYLEGDVVPVSFQNLEGKRVWMAVYPAYTDPNNLDFSSSEDWSWPCGSKDCAEQALTSGTLALENVGKGNLEGLPHCRYDMAVRSLGIFGNLRRFLRQGFPRKV